MLGITNPAGLRVMVIALFLGGGMMSYVHGAIATPGTTIARTVSSETICYPDGTCNLLLYSGIRFVEEDGKWKDIREARSLKNAWKIVYLEKDPDFGIEVKDYNYTSISLNLDFTGNWGNYPGYCNITADGAKCKFKLELKYKEWNESLKDFDEIEIECEYEFELEDGIPREKKEFKYLENPLGKNFSFGGNSTTIQLQDAGTENLEDTYVADDTPTSNRGSQISLDLVTGYYGIYRYYPYIKFNNSPILDILALPGNIEIQDATFSLYQYTNMFSIDEAASVYHVYNQTWGEMIITWNTQPCGTGFDLSDQCNLTQLDTASTTTGAGVWMNWNVTTALKNETEESHENISFHVRGTGGGMYNFYSKESTTDTTKRPYLNITFFTAANPPSMECNIKARGSCPYTMILYMQNDTGGYNNAHAQNVSEASYNYGVCCNATNGTIGVDCGTVFLKLSSVTNAHVQYPTVGTYPVDACISNTLGKITCYNTTGSCSAPSTCLLSYASSGNDNATNAHVASCNHYGTQLCCTLEYTPNTTMILNTSSGNNYTNEDLDCYANVADPDNATVNVWWQWWNGTTLKFSGMKAGLNTGELILITTLALGNTSKDETWKCSVMAGDGTSNETWNNRSMVIRDSCTYINGNWMVDCSHNCIISAAYDLNWNDIIFYNPGTFAINAAIRNVNRWVLSSECRIIIGPGYRIG